MANRRQSIKKIRVDKRRTACNVRVKSELKTVTKKVQSFIAANNFEEAAKALPLLFSKLDRASKRKLIHDNKASRRKARFSKRIAALKATPSKN